MVLNRLEHVDPAHGSYSCVVEARESLAMTLRHTPALAPVQEDAQDDRDEDSALHFLINSLVGEGRHSECSKGCRRGLDALVDINIRP